jgi:hypothetical protein
MLAGCLPITWPIFDEAKEKDKYNPFPFLFPFFDRSRDVVFNVRLWESWRSAAKMARVSKARRRKSEEINKSMREFSMFIASIYS